MQCYLYNKVAASLILEEKNHLKAMSTYILQKVVCSYFEIKTMDTTTQEIKFSGTKIFIRIKT